MAVVAMVAVARQAIKAAPLAAKVAQAGMEAQAGVVVARPIKVVPVAGKVAQADMAAQALVARPAIKAVPLAAMQAARVAVQAAQAAAMLVAARGRPVARTAAGGVVMVRPKADCKVRQGRWAAQPAPTRGRAVAVVMPRAARAAWPMKPG